MKKSLKLIAGMVLSAAAMTAQAESLSTGIAYEQDWAQALSISEVDSRVEALQAVESSAREALKVEPENVELLIVKGNAKIEIANALNNRRSLGYLRDGRRLLEQAIELEPMAMDSMAEARLAAVFYWAPGRPLSFGNKRNAIKMFEEALAANPDSAEILIQYGHAMNVHGENDPLKAKELYQTALERIEAFAFEGRHELKKFKKQEVEEALAELS